MDNFSSFDKIAKNLLQIGFEICFVQIYPKNTGHFFSGFALFIKIMKILSRIKNIESMKRDSR